MDARERFVAAVTASPDDVPLDVAAFCIAAHAHPGLDVDDWSRRIDTIAARCSDATFDGLRAQLFDQDGFHGDLDNYADPENSFLDSVIERRRGIPITLSVLMIAVGRRLGLDVRGVGMPGHFLVLDARAATGGATRFTAVRSSTPTAAGAGSTSSTAARCKFQRAFLDPTPPPAIVARMLANLERGELASDPVQRAWMCELHLAIPGISFQEQWELADQLARTGDMMRAASEYDRLAERIESTGSDPDDAADRLRTRARSLRARAELSAVPEPRPLPMFPLGTVLFPHGLLPLRVFEPRYRLMTDRVLRGDGEFGVVLIERGSEVGGGDTRFETGTVARVVRLERLADGGYLLATVGIRRIRVVQWLPDDPYPQADVIDVEEPAAGDAGIAAEPVRSPCSTTCARSTASAIRAFRSCPPSPTTPSRRRTSWLRWHRSARSTRNGCSRLRRRPTAWSCSRNWRRTTRACCVPAAISWSSGRAGGYPPKP